MERVDHLLVAYGLMPRLAVALLCGAALGLSGTIFQQVLRNRLAEPSTLGVSAGANLALLLATLWYTRALGGGQELIALTGGALGGLLSFLIARRQGYSPTALILAGLVVGLYCGSAASVAMLYNHDHLANLFLWQAGSLHQGDWSGVLLLLPSVSGAWFLSALAMRPIALLNLGDSTAAALGLKVRLGRIAALIVAVALGGLVASVAGMISFIGLAAPNLVHLFGARTPRQQLLWSPAIGAALLWLADGLVQVLGSSGRELPTGAATALLGAPLLLFLLVRRGQAERSAAQAEDLIRSLWPCTLILLLVAMLLAGLLAALVLGRSDTGWSATWPGLDAAAVLQWRWPRVLSAAAAGSLLAIAGCVLQRMTGNPLASPEILGMTSGATLGYMVQIMFLPITGQGFGLIGAGVGAGASLYVLLFVSRRSAGGPDWTLLVGVALTTLSGALMSILFAAGHPALRGLMGWMAGSTSGATASASLLAAAAALLAALLLPMTVRWLRILPLGPSIPAAVGVPDAKARSLLLGFCAAVTGIATLLVGPMGFVGLMAPHIARRMGLAAVGAHLSGSALLGAGLLVASDWLGRIVIFPWEIPAGLVCAFVGAPYFMWLMQRRAR